MATIYEHSNYAGRALRLNGTGDYDHATLGSHSFNDLTSSVKIEPGHYLEVYTDPGFKGDSAVFTGSTSYVGDGFNDKVSSLRLLRGTPDSRSTIDLSNYGAAYRGKPTPSPAPALDTITGQPINTIRKISDFPQPLSRPPLQGVWNNGAFIVGVGWKDPVTGATVKSAQISTGKASYMPTGPGNRAYDVNLTVLGTETVTAAIKMVVAGGFAALGASAGGPAGAFAGRGLGMFFGDLVPNFKNQAIFVKSPSMDRRHLDVFGHLGGMGMTAGGPLPDISRFKLGGPDLAQRMDALAGVGNHPWI